MIAYRLLTDDDSSEVCHRVTEALSLGWELYGDTQYAYDEKRGVMRCAQAVIKKSSEIYSNKLKLSNL